ncbi:MAG TPA: hypothetical protein VMT10_05830 [Solirubrobacteraceae bacterium]|nr:hypothetical protein [Solirubrobacteraceae bacterium]
MRYSLNTITRRASMGIAVLAAGVCVAAPAAQAETSGQAVAGSTVHIDTCRVAKSYHQDFTYAYCAIVSETNGIVPNNSISVNYKVNLPTFTPKDGGTWDKGSGTVKFGGGTQILNIKFAVKGKTVAQVKKSLKVTISNAKNALITAGGAARPTATAVAAGLTGTAVPAQPQTPTGTAVPAQPETPNGPLIAINNCTVKQSRNAGGFVWASCSIVTTNIASADSPAVSFRSNLKPFNPRTNGTWSKQTGTLELGSITAIKFAYKHKTLSQVRKSLKVTLSKPVDGTITDGTAVAKS